MSKRPVTELVRIPLAIPFEQFLSTFTTKLEPVLLAQRGIISVQTGKIISPGSPDGDFAVSLTQWESMDAHEAFTEGEAAKPFFETLEPLAKGPPTIEHYYLGIFPRAALQATFAHVIIHHWRDVTVKSRVDSHDKTRAIVEGSCLEIDRQRAHILFSGRNEWTLSESSTLGQGTAFVVRIERSEEKSSTQKTSSHL